MGFKSHCSLPTALFLALPACSFAAPNPPEARACESAPTVAIAELSSAIADLRVANLRVVQDASPENERIASAAAKRVSAIQIASKPSVEYYDAALPRRLHALLGQPLANLIKEFGTPPQPTGPTYDPATKSGAFLYSSFLDLRVATDDASCQHAARSYGDVCTVLVIDDEVQRVWCLSDKFAQSAPEGS